MNQLEPFKLTGQTMIDSKVPTFKHVCSDPFKTGHSVINKYGQRTLHKGTLRTRTKSLNQSYKNCIWCALAGIRSCKKYTQGNAIPHYIWTVAKNISSTQKGKSGWLYHTRWLHSEEALQKSLILGVSNCACGVLCRVAHTHGAYWSFCLVAYVDECGYLGSPQHGPETHREFLPTAQTKRTWWCLVEHNLSIVAGVVADYRRGTLNKDTLTCCAWLSKVPLCRELYPCNSWQQASHADQGLANSTPRIASGSNILCKAPHPRERQVGEGLRRNAPYTIRHTQPGCLYAKSIIQVSVKQFLFYRCTWCGWETVQKTPWLCVSDCVRYLFAWSLTHVIFSRSHQQAAQSVPDIAFCRHNRM